MGAGSFGDRQGRWALTTRLAESSGTLRPLVRLALPVLAEQILFMLVGLSDTWLAGRYFDAQHLAAINVLIYLVWLIGNLFAVAAVGATALTARFVGAGQWDDARRVVNQAYLLGIGVVLLAVAGMAGGRPLIAAMQLRGASAEYAVRYLYWVLPALPCLMAWQVGVASLRGAGDTVSGLVSMGITNVVNLAVAWPLVLGLGPLPQVGWDGLGIGAAAGYTAGGLFVTWRLARGRGGLQLEMSKLRPDWALLRRLLWIGVPGGADMLTVTFCQLWFVAIINQLGDTASAAHGVAIRLESLGYLPGYAFQLAAATMAGQFLGARDPPRARRSVGVACGAAAAVMGTAGVLFYTSAEPLVRLFVRAEEGAVIATAAPLLQIVAFAMVPLALLQVLTGALRGAGDTRWPLVITLLGYLGVRIPLTYGLALGWNYGVRGAWLAMLADLAFRSALVTGRFLQGGWQRVRV